MTWRDHGVAVLVVAHLIAVLVLSIPRPMVSEADLTAPGVRDWIARTAADLRGVGLPVTDQGLEDAAVTWGARYLALRAVFVQPASVYTSWTGAQQSWTMFANVPSRSAVLVIEVEEDDGWREVFRARDDVATWRRAFFDHARARTLVNGFSWQRDRPGYNRLLSWLEPALAAEVPGQRWRVGMQTVVFPAPAELARTGSLSLQGWYWRTILPRTDKGATDAAPMDDAAGLEAP